MIGSQNDIEFRIGDPTLSTAIGAFSTSPITANPVSLTDYGFTFEVLETDKVTAAPNWIYVDAGNTNVMIDSTLVPAAGAGTYNFLLKANVQNHDTAAFAFVPFTVTLYTYTAQPTTE